MAFNQRMAIEVDAAVGADVNGGGFDDTTGTPGTNYAWGVNQAVTAYTDLASAGAGSTVTSAAHPFGATHVGNIINITGGTNFTTGRYQVSSVAGVTATLDRAVTTGVGSAGTGNLGGALATQQKGFDVAFINAGAVADCRCYIKQSAYTGTLALVTAGSVAINTIRNRVIGYFAVHDDDPTPQSGNQPSYAVGSGAGVNGLTITTAGFSFENLTLDGTVSSGTAGVKGVSVGSSYHRLTNCRIKNFSAEGYSSTASNLVAASLFFIEVTGCAGTTASVVCGGQTQQVIYCDFHKNTKCGLYSPNGYNATVIDTLLTNNSGASSDGAQMDFGNVFMGNVVYGNGRDGLRVNGPYNLALSFPCFRNIFAKNAGYGLSNVTAPLNPQRIVTSNFNAYYSNTLGARNNIAAGDNDVAVTVNPFVSTDANLAAETSPDWSLNATPGAGASIRAMPMAMPGLAAPLSYRDPGVYQHLDSPGARVLAVVSGAGATSFVR